MTNIYRFPPVGLKAIRPRHELPVTVSRYATSGARTVSAYGPRRSLVDLTVSSLANDRAGAGYLQQLMIYLDGGVHLVRLTLPPVNWHLDHCTTRADLGNAPVFWLDGANPVQWVSGSDPVYWFLNAERPGVPVSLAGYPAALQVSNLPPGRIVARPRDVIEVFSAEGESLGKARVLDLTRADAAGVAVLPIDTALAGGIVSFGAEETAIFEVTRFEPGVQPVGGDWLTEISLREVLLPEITSPVEVDPWRA